MQIAYWHENHIAFLSGDFETVTQVAEMIALHNTGKVISINLSLAHKGPAYTVTMLDVATDKHTHIPFAVVPPEGNPPKPAAKLRHE